MKVLLFSNDLMPFGNLPTSGGGLRCWQLKCGLEAHGVTVVSSMPGFTYLAEKYRTEIPEEQRELLWNWGKQDAILDLVKPDAVLFASNWDHYNLTRPIDVPLIIDLHGSRLIETTMWQNPVSTDHKVRTLAKADCLLCAGKRQRTYFYGWLVQAGRVPKDEHFIRYIPISMDPQLPGRNNLQPTDDRFPHFVSGGGWFPWQNQAQAIFSVCEAVVSRNRGQVAIYGTPHETQNMSAEEREIREIFSRVKKLSEQSSRVQVHGYVGRQDLLRVYQSASVALEAMNYNLERELAFTTRTIEYLWCGLPVLYNDFSEISEHIRDFDAGWTVNPASKSEIDSAISEIFDQPDLVLKKSQNAQRLVAERFSWDKTIQPLMDFLKAPTKAGLVEPAVGAVRALPSFLSPRGYSVNIPLEVGKALEQSCIVPADDIIRLELPFSVGDQPGEGSVKFSVLSKNGKLIAEQSRTLVEIATNPIFGLAFPFWKRPKGGNEILIRITLQAEKGKRDVYVRGVRKGTFPFVLDSSHKFLGQTHKGEKLEAETIALSFVPGYSQLSKITTLARRAWLMMKNGQWRRLYHAAAARIPLSTR